MKTVTMNQVTGQSFATQKTGAKMRALLSLILIASVYSLVACQPKDSTSASQDSTGTLERSALDQNAHLPGADGTVTAEADGASSGGGAFLRINAEPLLDRARQELADQILRSSKGIFENFPKDWTREKLSQVILDVRKNFEHDSKRDRNLMMDYGKDEKGEYIEVLRPFAFAYAGVPVKGNAYEAKLMVNQAVFDMQRKILHEVAHFWVGGDDEKAELMSERILRALNGDIVACGMSKPYALGYGFYFIRSTGQLQFGEDAVFENWKSDWKKGQESVLNDLLSQEDFRPSDTGMDYLFQADVKEASEDRTVLSVVCEKYKDRSCANLTFTVEKNSNGKVLGSIKGTTLNNPPTQVDVQNLECELLTPKVEFN